MRRRSSILFKIEEVGGLGLLSVSTITLAELDFGIRILPEGHRKANLLESLENMMGTGMEARPFSVEAVKAFSEVGAKLRNAGIGIFQ